MKNTHTLTRVTKTAFDELNKIKKVTGLSHVDWPPESPDNQYHLNK